MDCRHFDVVDGNAAGMRNLMKYKVDGSAAEFFVVVDGTSAGIY